MPRYEVKCWITVDVANPQEAEAKAAEILDTVAEKYRGQTSIEGEGAVYEVEDDG